MNATSGDDRKAVYIVDGLRTPFLKARGEAGPFSAADLATLAGRALLLRQPFEPRQLDQVILGCVMPAPDEVNIARLVALRLGCGYAMPAWTVQRNCASGLQAIDSAVREIQGGHSHLVLAGGVEAMSRAPLQFRQILADWLFAWPRQRGLRARLGHLSRLRLSHFRPVIALLKGLTDPLTELSMGQTAEIIAREFHITRQEMDAWAVRSHQHLAAAQEQGLLKEEVTPIFDGLGRMFQQDDGLYRETSTEKLARLTPAFDRELGSITAGNSAQITDGAAWLLLADDEAVERHRLPVLARVWPATWVGVDPGRMGLGPVHATAALLDRHHLTMENVGLWEINEAFAGQVLACVAAMADATYCRQELGREYPLGYLPGESLNREGGAIGIGHPVGASGARLALHLTQSLHRAGQRWGVASLCVGGGQGGALLLEAV